MDFDKALHSTRVVVDSGTKDATILIKNGKILAIAEGKIPAQTLQGRSTEELGDAVIMPGVIDAHVHINEPGRTDWEGFDTATQAAAAGGITTLIEMPLNASPVTISVSAFEQKVTAADGKLHVDCGFYGGLVPGNLTALPALMRSGVFGIKCFLTHSGINEFPNVPEHDLKKAMPLIAKTGLPLLVHAELDTPHPMLAHFKNHPRSYKAYLKSRPKSWENKAIELMLRLCESTGCRTHIVHLSSTDLLDKLRRAKQHLPLTIETAPHYLYFAAEDIPDAQTVYKCAPPIRERANNARLWQALKAGTIDFIGSDHSPAPPALKEIASGDLSKAWGGISGVQFTLPVVWTRASSLGFSLADISRWLCSGPAAFLGLSQKGRIAPGMDADLVVWQPEETFVVEEKDIRHQHKITPYLGEELQGRILETWLGGERIFAKGALTDARKGKVLFRQS